MQRKNVKVLVIIVGVLLIAVLGIWLLRQRPSTVIADTEEEETAAEVNEAPLSVAGVQHNIRAIAAAVEEEEEDSDTREVISALSGRVINGENGGAVAGALVVFEHEGEKLTVKSRKDGSFYFKAREEGLYNLSSASCAGFQTYMPPAGQRRQNFHVVPGLEISDMVITLQPVYELSGLVVTFEREPVAGARVCLLQSGYGQGNSCVTTDENGIFSINAPGMTLLEASHENYRPGRYHYHGQQEEIVIVLGESLEGKDLFSISGQVVDSQDNGIAGVTVSAFVQNGEAQKPHHPGGPDERPVKFMPYTTTDEEGHFRLEKLDAGQYMLVARLSGFEPGSVTEIDSGREDVKIVMQNGYKLSGRVTDQQTGAPIQSYTVMIGGVGRRTRTQSVPVFDADGRFEISGLQKYTMSISIVAHGYAPSEERRVMPFDNQPMEENFELVGGGRVFGTVIDGESGEPVGGAIITGEAQRFSTRGAGGYHGRAVSAPDGSFEFYGLAIGTRSMEVVAKGYNARLVSGLEVAPGGEVGPLTVELSRSEEGGRPAREITGIGAVLGKVKDGVMVHSLVTEGAAAAAGLQKGDIILEVDGTNIGENNFRDVVEAIRGEEGSSVNLQVRHQDGSEETISVVRTRFTD